jgi:hypothetical protein
MKPIANKQANKHFEHHPLFHNKKYKTIHLNLLFGKGNNVTQNVCVLFEQNLNMFMGDRLPNSNAL